MAAYPNKDFTRYSIEGLLKETLQEEYGYGYSRYELIDALKKLGYKYKWDKYSDAQLYYMLNWAENKKVKIEKENQEVAEETAKLYSNQKKNKKLEITKHPDADKLIVTKVNVGDEILQIVTGADNVKVGDIVPIAKDGSELPGDVKIKTGMLRGVQSWHKYEF